MRLKTSNSRFAKERRNSFNKSKHTATVSGRSQRTLLGLPAPKFGYEFFTPTRSLLSHNTIEQIRIQLTLVQNIQKMDLKKYDGPMGLIHADLDSDRILDKDVSKDDEYIVRYHRETFIDYQGKFPELENKPVIVERKVISAFSAGGLLVKTAMKSKDQRYMYGIGLMIHILGFYTWAETRLPYEIDNYMQMLSSQHNQEDGDAYDMEDGYNEKWREEETTVDLYHFNLSVKLSKIARLEVEWERQHEELQIRTHQAITKTPIAQVTKWIEKGDQIGLWLKALVYLVVQRFCYSDYKTFDTNDYDGSEHLPLLESFMILYTDDEYLTIHDDYVSGMYPNGLTEMVIERFVFENAMIQHDPKRDHELMVKLMHIVFDFDFSKKRFRTNEKYDSGQILTCIGSLRLLKWKRLLHRTIGDYAKQRATRLDSDERKFSTHDYNQSGRRKSKNKVRGLYSR